MIKATIDQLPEILQSHICSIAKTSIDQAHGKNMCSSQISVIHFDKIPNEYARGKGWAVVPMSNDALYISSTGEWFFIEFKNGNIDKAPLFKKIYDSLLMLIDLKIIPDLDFMRKNGNYILVYNSEKYSNVLESEHLNTIYNHVFQEAKKEKTLFDIEKFQQFIFKETHTYTPELFDQNFIIPMENQEKIQ